MLVCLEFFILVIPLLVVEILCGFRDGMEDGFCVG